MGMWSLNPPVGNFSAALFGKTRNAVLGLLFGHPDESFYVREIVRTLGAGPGSVQRELESLQNAGVLIRTTRGRQVFYQANPQSPIFGEIKSLMLKTTAGAELLTRALSWPRGKVKVAFMYGSMARGQQRRGSDIDLFVVGDVAFGQVVEALAPAQKKLAREINPVVYPVSEFREKVLHKHHFITSVLRGPKLFLVGDERELAKLAGAGLDTRT